MVRQMMIAVAIAAMGLSVAATAASARGGFHGFHRGFYGPRFGYYGYGYPYWDFPYSSYLYDDTPDCYKEVRVVRTRHGVRSRLATVCE